MNFHSTAILDTYEWVLPVFATRWLQCEKGDLKYFSISLIILTYLILLNPCFIVSYLFYLFPELTANTIYKHH